MKTLKIRFTTPNVYTVELEAQSRASKTIAFRSYIRHGDLLTSRPLAQTPPNLPQCRPKEPPRRKNQPHRKARLPKKSLITLTTPKQPPRRVKTLRKNPNLNRASAKPTPPLPTTPPLQLQKNSPAPKNLSKLKLSAQNTTPPPPPLHKPPPTASPAKGRVSRGERCLAGWKGRYWRS